MSDVTLSVSGRNYTVACADGDEDRVRELAAMVEDRLNSMGATLNSPMEAKNLLIAGLVLADELDEAKKSARTGVPPEVQGALDKMALRLEKVAEVLEGTAPNA